ncbi:hypothetical protein ESCO_001475 [Escovopsis weberi]|uniref:SigF-like NTF2-like domain-containing protein n=1 Tax=Escovopsis weberi TaxID=150374 RepID=A0A0M9VWM0_ESCWE|nr:hypothetical protein ESCO_001475 [Escovopsis weberi]
MENPAQEIAHVVRSLTMGSPQQQQDAITAYFLSDASFAHPFCRVPSFPRGAVPFAPGTDSRALVLAVYRWYRTLSPRIQLSVDSAVFDDRTGLLYLSIHQIFSLWFLPFHKADVQLVTVLHLVRRASPNAEHARPDGPAGGTQPAEQKLKQKEEGREQPAQEEQAQQEQTQEQQEQKQEKKQETQGKKPVKQKEKQEKQHQRKATQRPPEQQLKYYIASQHDLYQVTDFLKFVALPFVPLLLCFLQLLSMVLCVVGSVLLRPLYHFMNDVSDREVGIEL